MFNYKTYTDFLKALFAPAEPVFYSIIETAAHAFNLDLLKKTRFGHLLHNKELVASFAF